jgi:hypothetical protein
VPHSTPRHPHLVPCKNTNNHPLSLLSRTSTASHPSQNSDKKRLHAVYRPAPHTRRTTLSHLCRPSLHPQHRPKASTQPVTSLQAPVLHSSPVARHPSRGVRRFLQPRVPLITWISCRSRQPSHTSCTLLFGGQRLCVAIILLAAA